jgi:predicted MFS family arabinose efflux permease
VQTNGTASITLNPTFVLERRTLMNYRIFILAIGTFVIGTEGFKIAGLLPALARDLHTSVSAAGQLVTAFSIAYALGSPVLTTLTGLAERRKLLTYALFIFALGNILCGLAPNYGLILVGRIVAAAGAGLFTPAANHSASILAAPGKRGQALSIVIGGMTVALVLGVPLGNWIASVFDWKMTFWFVGIIALVATVCIRLFFPAISAPASVTLAERLSFLKNSTILTALSITLAWAFGIYVVYTYIGDIFGRVGAGENAITVMLLISGIASFLGVNFGGFAADRYGPARTIVLALLLLMVAVVTLSFFKSVAFGIAAMALWGFAGFTFNPAQQHRLIGLSGKDSGVVLSLHNSTLYVGTALGSIIGGLVIQYGSVTWLGLVGGAVVLIGLVVFLFTRRHDELNQKKDLSLIE